MAKSRKPAEISAISSAIGVIAEALFKLVCYISKFDESLKSVYRLVTPEGERILEDMARACTGVIERWRRIDDETMLVNLDAQPQPPDNMKIAFEVGERGWVEVQNCDGNLFVDGREAMLIVYENQTELIIPSTTPKGQEIWEKVQSQPVLRSNILDALIANPEIIPENWKSNNDRILFIVFWGSIFCKYSTFYVECLYHNEHGWKKASFPFHDFFMKNYQTAILEEDLSDW